MGVGCQVVVGTALIETMAPSIEKIVPSSDVRKKGVQLRIAPVDSLRLQQSSRAGVQSGTVPIGDIQDRSKWSIRVAILILRSERENALNEINKLSCMI